MAKTEKFDKALEQLVEEIITIDSEAKKIVDAAEAKKEEAISSLDSKKQKIHQKYIDEANRKLEKFKANKQKEMDKELKESAEKFNTDIKKLEATAFDKKDEWVDSIVKKTLA